jgi:hypothetical protein
MQLLPGTNSILGLNTLGGALTLNMTDGFLSTRAGAQVSAGSLQHTEVSAEGGANHGTLAGFVAFEGITENGWRELVSRPRQQLRRVSPGPSRSCRPQRPLAPGSACSSSSTTAIGTGSESRQLRLGAKSSDPSPTSCA